MARALGAPARLKRPYPPRHVKPDSRLVVSAGYGAASAIGPFRATGRRPDIEIEDCGGQIQRAAYVVDEAAAAQLANAEFYRYAVKYKPAQQKC